MQARYYSLVINGVSSPAFGVNPIQSSLDSQSVSLLSRHLDRFFTCPTHITNPTAAHTTSHYITQNNIMSYHIITLRTIRSAPCLRRTKWWKSQSRIWLNGPDDSRVTHCESKVTLSSRDLMHCDCLYCSTVTSIQVSYRCSRPARESTTMQLTGASPICSTFYSAPFHPPHYRPGGLPDLLRHARYQDRVQPSAPGTVLQEAIYLAEDHVRAIHYAPVQVLPLLLHITATVFLSHDTHQSNHISQSNFISPPSLCPPDWSDPTRTLPDLPRCTRDSHWEICWRAASLPPSSSQPRYCPCWASSHSSQTAFKHHTKTNSHSSTSAHVHRTALHCWSHLTPQQFFTRTRAPPSPLPCKPSAAVSLLFAER